MKKTLVIDESIRESVHQTFKRESALQYSYKVLMDIAEQCRQAAWNEMYERHPVLKGTHAVVNFNTWACTYEQEEYTREGENVIEAVDDGIHPIFNEVHTPPPLEGFCGIGVKDGN